MSRSILPEPASPGRSRKIRVVGVADRLDALALCDLHRVTPGVSTVLLIAEAGRRVGGRGARSPPRWWSTCASIAERPRVRPTPGSARRAGECAPDRRGGPAEARPPDAALRI